jgi:hypothetical protein
MGTQSCLPQTQVENEGPRRHPAPLFMGAQEVDPQLALAVPASFGSGPRV